MVSVGLQQCLDHIWGVSSRYLGEYRCHINHKQLNRSRHIKLLPFLPVTSHSQHVLNFGVSVRCLEGVWKVSAGCLGDSGYCLVYWLYKKSYLVITLRYCIVLPVTSDA